jgi:cell division protease FtsH
MGKKLNLGLIANLGLFFVFIWAIQIWKQNEDVKIIPYSEFSQLLQEEKIDNLDISDDYIRGKFKISPDSKIKKFITTRVDTKLAEQLEKKNITYNQTLETHFLKDLLSWVVPVALFFVVWLFISRKMAEQGGLSSGLMAVGKSKAKLYVETEVKVSFNDIAGVDEAKTELQEVVEFLKNPEQYSRLGARMPKGILLVGPPGTGKTLLAKAVAGEAKVPFFSIGGSEFVELFVGVGAARVRDLFDQARKKSPCIIFIDELDSLGKVRAPQAFAGGHDEKEQTLNQLLAELDGFDTTSGIILLAATNRPEILDPALLRAGRFDRQVLIDKPDKNGRLEIFKVHIKKIKCETNLKIEHLAELTPGFTGADIANLINEAALIATRRKSELVNEDDFTKATERLVAGLERKSRVLSAKERKIVAYHEMGHVLVASLLETREKIHKVSIIPRGIGSLGYTIQRPTEDRYIITHQELLNKIAVLLGGRMAELLIFNETSTGAADDLARATDIATAMITKYGMSPRLGPVIFEIKNPQAFEPQARYSERIASDIDAEIQKTIEESAIKTLNLLKENHKLLEKGALLLLEKETLNEEEIRQLNLN